MIYLLLLSLPGVMQLVITVAAFLTACGVVWKFIYLPLRRHFNRVNAGMDTLLGYPAVKDPGSGRVIQPATPPLAARVYDLEETNKKMAEALATIANNQRQLLELEREMEERKRAGEAIVQEFTDWRTDVDERMRRWVQEQDELAKIIRGRSLEA